MDNIKVSVIVPIYNAEKYLEKSLLFLGKQTLEGIEIILINDASTDKSLDIMTAFKIVFPEKFVVIDSKENRGPGGARNIGISHARGEYIGFVDSDDYINEQMFELLYNKAKEKDSDLVMCAYRYMNSEDVFIDTDAFESGLTAEARGKLIAYTGFLWHSIFKKSVFDDMGYLFRERYTFQDIDFLCEAYCRINSIDFVHKSLYLYTDNKGSVSHKDRNLTEYSEIIKRCIDAINDRCANTPYINEIREALDFVIIKVSLTIISTMAATNDISLENVKNFQTYLQSLVPNYLENKYIKGYEKSNPLITLCDYDSEKFMQNILEYRRKGIEKQMRG